MIHGNTVILAYHDTDQGTILVKPGNKKATTEALSTPYFPYTYKRDAQSQKTECIKWLQVTGLQG